MGGRGFRAGFFFAIVGVAVVGCAPRSEPPRNSIPSWRETDDRSFYLGRPVTRPEDLSGVWEAGDGRGGAIGLHLVLRTTIPADAIALRGTVQSWNGLEVGLYQRSGQTVEIGEENWLSDSRRGGGVRYENGRLHVSGPAFDLDLQREPGDVWAGRFHREGFDALVTLRRPEMTENGKGRWYLGTWTGGNRTFQRCTHVGLGAGGALVAWSDALTELGFVRSGANVPHAHTATEIYGSLVKAHAENIEGLTIEFGAYDGWCCPLVLHGLRGRADTLPTVWESQPNHAAGSEVWRRASGESCAAGAGEDRQLKSRLAGTVCHVRRTCSGSPTRNAGLSTPRGALRSR